MRDSPAAAGAGVAAGAGAAGVDSAAAAVEADTAAAEGVEDSAAAHRVADFLVAGGLLPGRAAAVAGAWPAVASTAVRRSARPVGDARAAESPVVGVRDFNPGRVRESVSANDPRSVREAGAPGSANYRPRASAEATDPESAAVSDRG